MYYCNCLEGWKLRGKTDFNKRELEVGTYMYQEVPTRNGNCKHCGYTAYFSRQPMAIVEDVTVNGGRKKQILVGASKRGQRKDLIPEGKPEQEEIYSAGGMTFDVFPSDISEVG